MIKINNDNFFKAIYINKKNISNFEAKIKQTSIKEIFDKNCALIKVSYSSINYKDILLLNGNPGLVRKFPHIPGIDAAGKIIYSPSKKFRKGEKVVILGRPLGVSRWGGFSEYVSVPEKWIDKLPKKLSEKKSMIFGTAGFTAISIILKIFKAKISKDGNPILIAGGTTGVGIIISLILKKLGFKLVLTTRDKIKAKKLKKLGFNNILDSKSLNKENTLHLDKVEYSSIVDNIGGNNIQSQLKKLQNKGNYYVIGNLEGNNSKLNLMPLILRGVNIVGVNAEQSSVKERKKIIKFMSKYSNINNINSIFKEHKLAKLLNKKIIIKKSKLFGRSIIKMI
jgi:putative YhdH/YhfP family quinone oxidoreductase